MDYCGYWDTRFFCHPGQFFSCGPVSVGHSNPSPDGPRAPTQEPSKDKEERLWKGTYINEGGRVQDWLSLFLLLSTRYICRWYVMMTCPYPWAIGYRLRHGMPPPVRLVRLLRVSKRGVLRDTTLVDASLHDEFLHERQDTDLDLSLAQTTFHVRHLFVSTGHTQTSFSSRSWRLTRVCLHALLRCADHFNSTRL